MNKGLYRADIIRTEIWQMVIQYCCHTRNLIKFCLFNLRKKITQKCFSQLETDRCHYVFLEVVQAKRNARRGLNGLAKEVKQHEGTYKYLRGYSRDQHRPLRPASC